MSKLSLIFICVFALLIQFSNVSAQNPKGKPPLEDSEPDVAPQTPAPDFLAFTGKVIKNKVRLRHQPTLDSLILKELNQGDLIIVVGEIEDFYAVQPPRGIKGYVFRTFILDNIVEGNRVNVRLEPDLDSPIIGQLNAGDRIEGVLSPHNNKWIEISPPASARFFVAKDYIEKLGDASLMAQIEKRRTEAGLFINSTYMASQAEMQKPFQEINLDKVYANYNKIIKDYQDFPEQVSRAKELLEAIQENYLQKKIAFLEIKAKSAQEDLQNKNAQLNDQMQAQQQRLTELEQQIKKEKQNKSNAIASRNKESPQEVAKIINEKMAAWIPIEEKLYQRWAEENYNHSRNEFYDEQQREPIILKGILEPYTRVIKNKPGDYVLVNQVNHLPVAFLYSTMVDLQDKAGQAVTLFASPRPNNNFAFPAFFVLSVETVQ